MSHCVKQVVELESESESENEIEIQPKGKSKKVMESESEDEKELPKKPVKKPVKKTEPVSKPIFKQLEIEGFEQKLGKYTFSLDKVIPWEDNNFVFSGGLLLDIITNKFNPELTDIDLFFYGPAESKHKTINKLLDNLDLQEYYYLIGINSSVIYIFLQGVPRIIQLIMTDKTDPESIVNSFDFEHVKSYYDGTKLYSLGTNVSSYNPENPFTNIIGELTKGLNKYTSGKKHKKDRILKYFKKGYLPKTSIFNSGYHFVLNNGHYGKYVKNIREKLLYKKTNNLMVMPDNPNVPIDFTKITNEQIDFRSWFKCSVNYNKLSNRDFKEDVDMFGAFSKYMGILTKNLTNGLDELADHNYGDRTGTIDLYGYEINKASSLTYKIHNQEYLFVRCKFLKLEQVDFQDKKINKIFWEISNKWVKDYLLNIINKWYLIDKIKFNQETSNKDKAKKLTISKYELEESNISWPFENSSGYPKLNPELPVDFPDNSELVISSKLYNQEGFNSLNKPNLFENLVPGNKVNCIFNFYLYLNTDANQCKIKSVEINLIPVYVEQN